MLEVIHVLNGIMTMSLDCPADGNVTVDFTVHNGRIVASNFTKTYVMVSGGKQVNQEKVRPISPVFTNKIITDVENLRIQFGTVKVSVDVAHGEVKNYSIIPEYSLNANLLKSELESHEKRLRKTERKSA